MVMMRSATAAVAAILLMVSAARAGDPVGAYKVEGRNPDKSSYSGTATVEKTGETYKVTWDIGGAVYVGTGIGDKNFLAVSYKAAGQTGLALYGEEGENWAGVWTYHNSRKVGAEKWTRQ